MVWLNFARASKRPVGILSVKVLRAMKLKKKDLMGASDPYVKLKLTEEKLPAKKTTVKHKNLNPEWNEEFNMVVKDPQSQALEIIVYDWEQVNSLSGNLFVCTCEKLFVWICECGTEVLFCFSTIIISNYPSWLEI